MILAADLKEDEVIIVKAAKPILQSGKWYYNDPVFAQYHLNGVLKSEKRHSIQSFSNYKLISNNSKIVFQTENRSFEITE